MNREELSNEISEILKEYSDEELKGVFVFLKTFKSAELQKMSKVVLQPGIKDFLLNYIKK